MKHFKDIEELIIDDSFINYCYRSDESDYAHWESFLRENPHEKARIEEAKRMVMGIRTALTEKHEAEKSEEVSFTFQKKNRWKKVWVYSSAAAAIFIMVFGLRYLMRSPAVLDRNYSLSEIVAEGNLHYKTRKGERELITLFDSTKIWLNADSELKIDKAYGKKDRSVCLTGEALFDVKHDEQLPFVVYTDKYQVRDLGTVFNVKAYPDDETSEASLIQGEIEVAITGIEEVITLKPNQKIVLGNEDVVKDNKKVERKPQEKRTEKNRDIIVIAPLSYSPVDSSLLETSWVDRVEFDNESLYEMKDKLERWFGVDIKIEDSDVGKYPFTATFMDENIEEALKALQYAYPFNFKIDKNEVIIKK